METEERSCFGPTVRPCAFEPQNVLDAVLFLFYYQAFHDTVRETDITFL